MDRPLVCLSTGHGLPSSSSSSAIGSAAAPNADSAAVSAASLLDIAGLILYGAQAVPIRLKVLLDRLMAGLPNDQVAQTLGAYGWNYDDYSRGYMLQVGVMRPDSDDVAHQYINNTLHSTRGQQNCKIERNLGVWNKIAAFMDRSACSGPGCAPSVNRARCIINGKWVKRRCSELK
jgi:hypothetical protein